MGAVRVSEDNYRQIEIKHHLALHHVFDSLKKIKLENHILKKEVKKLQTDELLPKKPKEDLLAKMMEAPPSPKQTKTEMEGRDPKAVVRELEIHIEELDLKVYHQYKDIVSISRKLLDAQKENLTLEQDIAILKRKLRELLEQKASSDNKVASRLKEEYAVLMLEKDIVLDKKRRQLEELESQVRSMKDEEVSAANKRENERSSQRSKTLKEAPSS